RGGESAPQAHRGRADARHRGPHGGARKKMVTPVSKRRAASVMTDEFRRSQTRSCVLVGLGRSTWRYKSRRPADEEIRAKLCELAQKRTRFGYRRLAIFLRREGHVVNHKKVFRLYRAEGLTLPRKRRKKALGMRQVPQLLVWLLRNSSVMTLAALRFE